MIALPSPPVSVLTTQPEGIGSEATARAAIVRRPPSVPLVAHDPYLSIWSNADRLTDDATRHWTGKPHPMNSLVRVDGSVYRLMGAGDAPAMPQTGAEVTPTRTMVRFAGAGVKVALTFTTPALPDDLNVLSRPATYVTWRVASSDGKAHAASLYFDAGALLAANEAGQMVQGRRERIAGMTALSTGTTSQPVLKKRGDDLRIDWGRLYVASGGSGSTGRVGSSASSVAAFSSGRALGPDGTGDSKADELALAFEMPIGRVGKGAVERTLTVAYDDGYAIELMGQRLRPYWRRNGMDAAGMLIAAAREHDALVRRCESFDRELTADLRKAAGGGVAGDDYAWLGALAYRQSLAAQKLAADANGQPLLFPKENDSNGCISTVDVIYPAAPLTLLFSPLLTKASLVPVLEYAASPRWTFPFAPHDLGTYPKANGQVYGGGERNEENQMPVEETGNMLLVLAALAKSEGNAHFCGPYWPVLTRWAGYLESKGFDPESQLSTDDFAGHLAHNANLSAKAIEGLGAYAMLARMRGETAAADRVRGVAEGFARKWQEEARRAEGRATRLAFDRPDTWSQKYSLVWDRILGLNLFPDGVEREETAFYMTKLNPYGLPLDVRKGYTKLDWSLWSATMGTQEEFAAIVARERAFLSATPDRVPMSDWHETESARRVGFKARSVVGGVFVKLLAEPSVWSKWVSRVPNPTTSARAWAPLPVRPEVREIIPTGRTTPAIWSYTFAKPSGDWTKPGYDDSGWKSGPSVFGTRGTPGATVRTTWDTGDIWLRREIELPATLPNGADLTDLKLYILHDEDAEVFLDGVLAAEFGSFTTEYEAADPSPAARARMTPGKHTIAVHCHQTGGGQSIDLGFGIVVPGKPGR